MIHPRETLEENTYLEYNKFRIFLNQWEEYLICDFSGRFMHEIKRNCFRTLEEAKNRIDELTQ